jgi:hypothetical protein
MKCPKCGARFVLDAEALRAPSGEPSDHDASPDTSQELPKRDDPISLPVSPGDLRDTFDLPLMTEAAAPTEESIPSAAKPQAADALALFNEPAKPKPKRPSAVESRSKGRRCPTCGGFVPPGMSLCSKCGLDLESGTRIDLDDDLMPQVAPKKPSAPLAVMVIAILCLVGSAVLTLLSFGFWLSGKDGWQYFIPVWLFGVFASVHLLRGHSAKFLIMALTLAAVCDVFGLIAVPVFEANAEARIVERRPTDPGDEDVAIEPAWKRLDTQRMGLGIGLLLVYAGVCFYLISPNVRRHYSSSR